ncbi:hypothetical protein FHS18_000605 [Paenibacillus phyllosphaerae]|uniref:Uncharacterized protein n=1 Tax=Paenibacillus phyllosphaerae TaxID=274593 RepID=A0A7W5ATW4_9BACL|nr:hypothetical protein [Paenibacillus phyllosphaerae]MBB3108577.1 hypothetical protein [Paenibacillus phyllosphaerae]
MIHTMDRAKNTNSGTKPEKITIDVNRLLEQLELQDKWEAFQKDEMKKRLRK